MVGVNWVLMDLIGVLFSDLSDLSDLSDVSDLSDLSLNLLTR